MNSKKSNPSKEDHFPVDSTWGKNVYLQSGVCSKKPIIEHDEDGYLTSNSVDKLYSFHPEVVLYCPQIPQNTGSIARLCAGFSLPLHLIEPMQFTITEKALRRAGLDYWPNVCVTIHKSWQDFFETRANRRFIFIETGSKNTPGNFNFLPGDILVFGAETFGVPMQIITDCAKATETHHLSIPMFNRGVRSFNLSNSVSMVTYLCVSKLWNI